LGNGAEAGRFERATVYLHKCLLKIPRLFSKNKDALRKSGEKGYVQTLNIIKMLVFTSSVLSVEHRSVLKRVLWTRKVANMQE